MRITGPLLRVLQVFLEDPQEDRYGYDLMKAAKLASGTLYPLLGRLEQDGLLASSWEVPSGAPGGRPPRRYYRLTLEGVRQGRLELAQAGVGVPHAGGTGLLSPGMGTV